MRGAYQVPRSLTAVAEALISLGGCPTLDAIAGASGLTQSRVRLYLEELAPSGGVEPLGDGACVVNKALLVAYAIRLGADPTRLSRHLSWRDFEVLVATALSEAGFTVVRGLRLPGKGGMEIDVTGAKGRLGVAVDCKRWAYRVSSPSRITTAARAQRVRAERLALKWDEFGLPPVRVIVPALVVLREDLPRFAEGVAVVPALALRGFIEELDSVVGEVGVRVG
ncbi:MAG: restriction endonuclease [Acidilobus sp.]